MRVVPVLQQDWPRVIAFTDAASPDEDAMSDVPPLAAPHTSQSSEEPAEQTSVQRRDTTKSKTAATPKARLPTRNAKKKSNQGCVFQ